MQPQRPDGARESRLAAIHDLQTQDLLHEVRIPCPTVLGRVIQRSTPVYRQANDMLIALNYVSSRPAIKM